VGEQASNQRVLERGAGLPARRTLMVSMALGMAMASAVLSPVRGQQSSTDQGGAEATGAQGQGAAGPGAPVNPSSLPEANPSAASGMLPPPRPRGGVSEEEYKARKAAAAKGSGEVPSPPAPAPATGSPPKQ
jgi:hypothetical protein